jgi:hypothetical protein
MILHVIVTVFQRTLPLSRLIHDFLLQTRGDWIMHIIHDGPASQELIDMVNSYRDSRINFTATKEINGYWGFPNRNLALKNLALNHRDFVLITNDDNMYIPKFMEYFLKETKRETVGFIYCNIIHSYQNYDILYTEIKQDLIDMGSFIVKLDIAKRVIFKNYEAADGAYAVACANYCRARKLEIVKINKALFIHN